MGSEAFTPDPGCLSPEIDSNGFRLLQNPDPHPGLPGACSGALKTHYPTGPEAQGFKTEETWGSAVTGNL